MVAGLGKTVEIETLMCKVRPQRLSWAQKINVSKGYASNRVGKWKYMQELRTWEKMEAAIKVISRLFILNHMRIFCPDLWGWYMPIIVFLLNWPENGNQKTIPTSDRYLYPQI